MKRFLAAISMAAAMGLGASVYAGPAIGSAHFRGGSFVSKSAPTQVERPYALTGSASEQTNYQWTRKVRWIGGHKARRILYVREAVQ